jgi:hypothetical protein
MKNINHIRLESLKRYQNDTFKAVVWYRENKALFRGKVFGPIQLAINLKDKRYAEHVESALGGKDSSHLRVRTKIVHHQSQLLTNFFSL